MKTIVDELEDLDRLIDKTESICPSGELSKFYNEKSLKYRFASEQIKGFVKIQFNELYDLVLKKNVQIDLPELVRALSENLSDPKKPEFDLMVVRELLSLVQALAKPTRNYCGEAWKDIRSEWNFIEAELEALYHRIQLKHPETRMDLDAAILWMAEKGNKADFELVCQVIEDPPSDSSDTRKLLETTKCRMIERLFPSQTEVTTAVSSAITPVAMHVPQPPSESKIGPLLRAAMAEMQAVAGQPEAMLVAASFGSEQPDTIALPVMIQLPRIVPEPGENWERYRERAINTLGPVKDYLSDVLGDEPVSLLASNALKLKATPEQIDLLTSQKNCEIVELDPLLQVVQMDDVIKDIELEAFNKRHPTLSGDSIRVAVLDSGVDTKHPFLSVADSVATCGESVDIPGLHGTHCAGSIASKHAVNCGVAPNVTLLNIKVLQASGAGRHTDIAKGIEEALNLKADILSISLGFNHLPAWSDRGHGWSCSTGNCLLCAAVDNAVALGAFVVVAAGNEHDQAEALRWFGQKGTIDTELSCPGQAQGAFTVGALTKGNFQPAPFFPTYFTSHGPSAYGWSKPDVSTAGYKIVSTIPARRDLYGNPILNPPLFGSLSGTSMATPIVAGAAALALQSWLKTHSSWTPQDIRNILLTRGITPLPKHSPLVVGAGRLDISNL